MELVIGKALLEEMDTDTVRAKLTEAGFDLTKPIAMRIDEYGDAEYSQRAADPAAILATRGPRVIAGLQEGRIVNYVMQNGEVRPLIVVNAWDRTGIVNGVLLFDGANDNGNFPQPLVAGHSGHMPLCAAWILSAKFDDSDTPAPGTWHFAPKQPCFAAGVDANALETAMLPIIERLMDTINAKLDACVKACNELTAPPILAGKHDHDGLDAVLGSMTGADCYSPAPEVTASATVETPADVAHNGEPANEPDLDAKTPELPS